MGEARASQGSEFFVCSFVCSFFNDKDVLTKFYKIMKTSRPFLSHSGGGQETTFHLRLDIISPGDKHFLWGKAPYIFTWLADCL